MSNLDRYNTAQVEKFTTSEGDAVVKFTTIERGKVSNLDTIGRETSPRGDTGAVTNTLQKVNNVDFADALRAHGGDGLQLFGITE